jgi:hypothetical protein
MHYNNPNFKTINSSNLNNINHSHSYIYKVYMGRRLEDDRFVIVVAASSSTEANSMIDNTKFTVITDDYFTDQFANNKGIIGEGQLPEMVYNSLKVKK